jgi:hypothetical protein
MPCCTSLGTLCAIDTICHSIYSFQHPLTPVWPTLHSLSNLTQQLSGMTVTEAKSSLHMMSYMTVEATVRGGIGRSSHHHSVLQKRQLDLQT